MSFNSFNKISKIDDETSISNKIPGQKEYLVIRKTKVFIDGKTVGRQIRHWIISWVIKKLLSGYWTRYCLENNMFNVTQISKKKIFNK